MQEAILQVRGGDGIIHVAMVLLVLMFINYYNNFLHTFGIEAFETNYLPYQDPIGRVLGRSMKSDFS